MSEHTKEPWAGFLTTHSDGKDYLAVAQADTNAPGFGKVVALFGEAGGEFESETVADIKRVCACVNACSGLSTEAIEQAGQLQIPVKKLTSDSEISEIRQQLAELLAIIKKSACDGANCHSCANPCDKYLEELR